MLVEIKRKELRLSAGKSDPEITLYKQGTFRGEIARRLIFATIETMNAIGATKKIGAGCIIYTSEYDIQRAILELLDNQMNSMTLQNFEEFTSFLEPFLTAQQTA